MNILLIAYFAIALALLIGLAVMIGVQYGMRHLRGQRTETD